MEKSRWKRWRLHLANIERTFMLPKLCVCLFGENIGHVLTSVRMLMACKFTIVVFGCVLVIRQTSWSWIFSLHFVYDLPDVVSCMQLTQIECKVCSISRERVQIQHAHSLPYEDILNDKIREQNGLVPPRVRGLVKSIENLQQNCHEKETAVKLPISGCNH